MLQLAKEKKSSKSGNKKVKKFFNTLWLVGTILSVLVVIAYFVISMITNYNKNKKESILQQLQVYNYEHFGYKPQSDVGNDISILDLHYEISSDLENLLDSFDCEVELLDTFSIVSIRVIEPNEDINSVAEKLSPCADYWEIISSGVSYYGTPNSPTLSINEINVVTESADSVDGFLYNLENAILNNTDDLIIYMDINYGMLPLTNELHDLVADKWSSMERADQLLIMLHMLKNTGEVTSKLDSLYSLYNNLM